MDTEHTQGSLTKEAIRLAWPAVCESFFIALAGMVDTFMVSTLGANAVAAVGLTTQPKFLGLALFIAANVAISALVARRFGEKRQQAANEILVMTICFCIVAAVVISLLTVGFADQIIEFCGSNEGHARHGCEILPDHHGRHDLQCIVHGNQCGTARRGQYDDRS